MRINPQRQCDEFNAKYAIGTAVRFYPIIGGTESRPGNTSTVASVLGGHTAVIWLTSERGCVALASVQVVQGS